MVSLQLPYPPSVNKLYRNVPGVGRVKTAAYKSWIALAAYPRLSCGAISGPVAVDITVGRPDKRKRDLDNLLKAVLDYLVAAEVIEDDSRVEDLRIRWGQVEGAHIEVKAA